MVSYGPPDCDPGTLRHQRLRRRQDVASGRPAALPNSQSNCYESLINDMASYSGHDAVQFIKCAARRRRRRCFQSSAETYLSATFSPLTTPPVTAFLDRKAIRSAEARAVGACDLYGLQGAIAQRSRACMYYRLGRGSDWRCHRASSIASRLLAARVV